MEPGDTVQMSATKSTDQIDFAKFREYLKQIADVELNPNYRRRVDVSDIVQTTLLEAHRHRERLRGDDSAAVAGWLRSILANNITDAVRQATRKRRDVRRDRPLMQTPGKDESGTGLEPASDQSSPSQHLVHDEMCAGLALAIASLPPDQREAVVFHHLQGMSLRDLSQQMNRSESSVAGLLFRGMKKLRELLDPNPNPR